MIVLPCLPGLGQNGVKKSPHLFGCELDSFQIRPCLFFQRLISLFPDLSLIHIWLKREYGYSDVDACLVLKDILAHVWKDGERRGRK